MNCPKCGSEQPDGTVECAKCGVIMAKVLKTPLHQAAISPTPTPAPDVYSEPDPAQKPAPLIAVFPAFIVVVVAAWWLNFPSSSPLPIDAYVNLKHQFALSAPREWLQLTPENYQQMMEEYKDRFPREMRPFIEKPGFEVSFVKIPSAPGEFSPSINVVVMAMKGDLPPLTEPEKEDAVKMLVPEMEKYIKDYALESASIVDVDGLASLRIVGNAPMTVVLQPSTPVMSEKGAFGWQHVVGHTQEVSKTFDLHAVQTLVPGKKRGYIISYTGESGSFSDAAPVFDEVTASFRVMERPPRFGPVVSGAMNGGLIGAGLYLFYILVGRVIMLFTKKE